MKSSFELFVFEFFKVMTPVSIFICSITKHTDLRNQNEHILNQSPSLKLTTGECKAEASLNWFCPHQDNRSTQYSAHHSLTMTSCEHANYDNETSMCTIPQLPTMGIQIMVRCCSPFHTLWSDLSKGDFTAQIIKQLILEFSRILPNSTRFIKPSVICNRQSVDRQW